MELIKKYKNGSMTVEEFEQLRSLVERCSDDELLNMLASDADAGLDDSPFGDADVRRMKDELMLRVKTMSHDSSTRVPTLYKFISRAAVLLLPLFMLATAFLYHLYTSKSDDIVCVTTASGERASVTLPDGSVVHLNALSSLNYRAGDFSSSQRQVDFSGEAYFDIAHKDNSTFRVRGTDYLVTVHGTAFNLTDKMADKVVLALDSGSVSFAAIPNGSRADMKPGDISVLHRDTRLITTTHQGDLRGVSSWKSGELSLRHVPLSVLFQRLADAYGLAVDLRINPDTNGTFTGVLPTGNLNEALDIIEQLYHIKCTVDGKSIIVE